MAPNKTVSPTPTPSTLKDLLEEILTTLAVLENGQERIQNTIDDLQESSESLEQKFEDLKYELEYPGVAQE